MSSAVFNIDLSESFPRLARPPIVEAAIYWQARAQGPQDPAGLAVKLAERLPQFSVRKPIQQITLKAMVADQDAAPVIQHKRGWEGMRLKSTDGCHVVQFTVDGLVFSRTRDYAHWEPFVASATDAWRAFVEIAAPVDIQQLGVRFINHIAGAAPENVREYLRDPPTCPSGLPLKEFVYQSTFTVPGLPFNVRVIKVLQPPTPQLPSSSGLFLDIDVFTVNAMSNAVPDLDQALTTMRWLKNRVFFTLLTQPAIQSFGIRP